MKKFIITILTFVLVNISFGQFQVKDNIRIKVPSFILEDFREIVPNKVFGLKIGNSIYPVTVIYVDSVRADSIVSSKISSNYIVTDSLKVNKIAADVYNYVKLSLEDSLNLLSLKDIGILLPNPVLASSLGYRYLPFKYAFIKFLNVDSTFSDKAHIEVLLSDSLNFTQIVSQAGDKVIYSNSDKIFSRKEWSWKKWQDYASYVMYSDSVDIFSPDSGDIVNSTSHNFNNHQVKLSNGEVKLIRTYNEETGGFRIYNEWDSPPGRYYASFGSLKIEEIKEDTVIYKNPELSGYKKKVSINSYNYNYKSNRGNYTPVVSKVGGVMIRHDNWLNGDKILVGLASYVSLLDKYDVKGVFAINMQDESYYSEKVRDFFRFLQLEGHELADHGPNHSNYNYLVPKDRLLVTSETRGVESITDYNAEKYKVVTDTFYVGNGDYYTSWKGMDIMFKRSLRLFDYIGLNPFTYYVQGGGQRVEYDVDSISAAAYINGILGGTDYYRHGYYHPGYNPPLDWKDKVNFSLNWLDEENITLDESQGAGYLRTTARNVIRKITNLSARNAVSIIGHHAELPRADFWMSCMDSVLQFIVSNQQFIRCMTGTEWTKTLYFSETNPYENVIPHNIYTNQVFEDDIDKDNIPDGWSFGELHIGTRNGFPDTIIFGDNNNEYILTGGSQGSKGCVSVSTADTLYMHNLYGLEKGKNLFSIDVKDYPGFDAANISVKIRFCYGDNRHSLSHADSIWTISSPIDWTTYEKEIVFPYNTSYLRMWIWSTNGKALVDEIVIRKK